MLIQQNFIFATCFLWSHFLLVAIPYEKVPTKQTFLHKRKSYMRHSLHCGLYLVCCFCFVSASKLTINQLMWTMLTTRLRSLFGLGLARMHREIALEVYWLVGPTPPWVALWVSWEAFPTVNDWCVAMTLPWLWPWWSYECSCLRLHRISDSLNRSIFVVSPQ
jgi:hypothetical protein